MKLLREYEVIQFTLYIKGFRKVNFFKNLGQIFNYGKRKKYTHTKKYLGSTKDDTVKFPGPFQWAREKLE